MVRSKYRNVRIKGFDSKAEYARWQELQLLEKGGKIRNLKRQVAFPMYISGKLVCTYVADFCYNDDRESIVEDVKGVRTDIYRIKRKLMDALYGIKIREVSAKDLRVRRKP